MDHPAQASLQDRCCQVRPLTLLTQRCKVYDYILPSHLRRGASNAFSVLKGSRLANIARTNNLPTIAMVQTAGASLPQQFHVFHTGGRSFRDIAIRSERGSPTCSVVFGSSTAGGAYVPGMSDYTIFVKNQARVFLGGPPLVKMATGEISTAEELGGADDAFYGKRVGGSNGGG